MGETQDEARDALVELARELVDELAGGRLLELMLSRRQAEPHPGSSHDVGGSVGGRKIASVLSHPDSTTVLYDLGGGHFAEEADGKVGPVMHSDQFRHDQLLAKGWRVRVSAGKPAES
jgi:hypothetical protein